MVFELRGFLRDDFAQVYNRLTMPDRRLLAARVIGVKMRPLPDAFAQADMRYDATGKPDRCELVFDVCRMANMPRARRLFIIAHEVGHVLDNLKSTSDSEGERLADAFAQLYGFSKA
jgi:hypothetical protein